MRNVVDPSVLRYPLSLLTLSALTESLQRLTAQRLSDSATQDDCDCALLRESIDVDGLMMSTGVACEDVTELCGWSDMAVEEVARWIGSLAGDAESRGCRGPLSAVDE